MEDARLSLYLDTEFDRTSTVADQSLGESYWEVYGLVEGSLEMISVHQGYEFNVL